MGEEAEKISNYVSDVIEKGNELLRSKFGDRFQRIIEARNSRSVSPNYTSFVLNEPEPVEVPGILRAYFAQKIVTEERSDKSAGTHEYKFNGENEINGENKETIAGYILNNLSGKLPNKTYTTLDLIVSVLGNQLYKAGDPVNIPLLKINEVITYQRIEEARLYNSVYIIVQSGNLSGKTATIEVMEKDVLLAEADSPISLCAYDDETDIDAEAETIITRTFNDEHKIILKIRFHPEVHDTFKADWFPAFNPDPTPATAIIDELWLRVKVQGEENLPEEHLKDDSYFKLNNLTGTVFDIFTDGRLEKKVYTNATKVTYIYHDTNEEIHELGTYDFTSITNNFGANYGGATVNMIDTQTLNNYENGDVSFGFTIDSPRRWMNDQTLGSLLGAMLECGFEDIVCNGFSHADGSSRPSKSHKNGYNGDFKYLRLDRAIRTGSGTSLDIRANPDLLDSDRQNEFIDALKIFGWGGFLGWSYTVNGITNYLNNIPKNTVNHHHHLHVQSYGGNLTIW